MYVFSMTRKQPTISQLKAHVKASLRQTIKRKAALRGLEVKEAKVTIVTQDW